MTTLPAIMRCEVVYPNVALFCNHRAITSRASTIAVEAPWNILDASPIAFAIAGKGDAPG